MAKYEMKFSFDWGSGVCLWSTNNAARNKYGYPVETSQLPISEELKKDLEHLISWHDKALDWNEPQNNLLWTDEQIKEFLLTAKEMFKKVCMELGADYDVVLIDGL